MKKLIWTVLMAVAAVLVVSCDRESIDYTGGKEDKPTGKASFATLSLSVNLEIGLRAGSEATTREVNTDNFIIRIFDKATGVQEEDDFTYGDMPEAIELTVGDYRIVALSAVQQPDGWDAPFYYGEQEFSIVEGETTVIDDLECVLQNVMVTIAFNNNLKELMEDDYTIVVSNDAGGELEFTKDNIDQAGYLQGFDDVSGDVYDKIRATFHGTVDGELISLAHVVNNVQPGDHCIITYSLIVVGSGEADLDITFNAECSVDNRTYEINPGDTTDPGTDPGPGPGPGTGEEITFSGVGLTSPVNVPIDIFETEEVIPVVVTIKASNGIANLHVTIISEVLTEDELGVIGLTKNFDLAYPGDQEDILLALGFPVGDQVINKTELEFDITEFVPMLAAISTEAGTNKFILKVTDNSGKSAETTLTINIVE